MTHQDSHSHSQPSHHEFQEKTNKHFDNEAAAWENRPGVRELINKATLAIEKNIGLNTNMSVLDLGCGTGLLSQNLSPHVKRVFGVDPSGSMITEFHKKHLPNGDAIKADLTTLEGLHLVESKGKDYDLIVSHMVFHHLAEPGKVLQSIHKLLKHGGILCITDLQLDDKSHEFHTKQQGEIPVAAAGGFAEETIKKLFESNGLVNVKIYPHIASIIKRSEGHSHTQHSHGHEHSHNHSDHQHSHDHSDHHHSHDHSEHQHSSHGHSGQGQAFTVFMATAVKP